MKVVVRPRFYEDVAEEAYGLLEKAGPSVAEHWPEALWRTVEFLQTSPFAGRTRTDLNFPGIRSWRVEHFSRWLIFCGLREDLLILYRVRSGTMNLPAMRWMF